MQHQGFRTSITTQGRRMAGARSLWRAGHAGDAVPHLLHQIQTSGHQMCAVDGRPVQRRHSGHISPEAAEGGAISLLEEGDIIRIDIPERSINVLLSDDELAVRRKKMEARGRDAYTPTKRKRKVSAALQARARQLTLSASEEVRIVEASR